MIKLIRGLLIAVLYRRTLKVHLPLVYIPLKFTSIFKI